MRYVILLLTINISVSVWAQPGDDWTQQSPSTKPSARKLHDMAYVGNGQAMLFGGNADGDFYSDETYIFSTATNSWTLKTPASAPSDRFRHATAYIGDDQAMLFGGNDGSLKNDTWVYDLSANTWTDKGTSSPPSARQCHDMAYIGGDQVMLFGGSGDDETWVYDLSANTWTQKSPSSPPAERDYHAMAYIGGDQVLLFGGYDAVGRDDETWLYDLGDNTWTNKAPSTKPSARLYHSMAYIGDDQVLLFGGNDGSNDNETWIYDLSANTWTQDTNSEQPSARSDLALGETSMSGSSFLVMFGGNDGSNDDETWTFGGGDYSLPVTLSTFTARIDNNGDIRLNWVTESETENLGFILERNRDGESWIEVASYLTDAELQGQGSVSHRTVYSFTDCSLEKGIYGYRLADVSYEGIKTYESLSVAGVSLISILPLQYDLFPASPNPFNPSTGIKYDLAEDTNVSLAIYDVQGRQVAALIKGYQQAGSYSLQWQGLDDAGKNIATGVYFCRLQAGEFSETIKMVYLR